MHAIVIHIFNYDADSHSQSFGRITDLETNVHYPVEKTSDFGRKKVDRGLNSSSVIIFACNLPFSINSSPLSKTTNYRHPKFQKIFIETNYEHRLLFKGSWSDWIGFFSENSHKESTIPNVSRTRWTFCKKIWQLSASSTKVLQPPSTRQNNNWFTKRFKSRSHSSTLCTTLFRSTLKDFVIMSFQNLVLILYTNITLDNVLLLYKKTNILIRIILKECHVIGSADKTPELRVKRNYRTIFHRKQFIKIYFRTTVIYS